MRTDLRLPALIVGIAVAFVLYTRWPFIVARHGLSFAALNQLWSQQKGTQAESTALDLADLTATALPTNSLVHLNMKPYDEAYWTAELNSHAEPRVRVPVYPAFDDLSQGNLICPISGKYNLTIRIPVPATNDPDFAHEPPICYPYRSMAQTWAKWRALTDEYAQAMIETCAARESTKNQWNGTFYVGPGAPISRGYEDSVVFETELTCNGDANSEDGNFATETQLDLLVDQVYGPGRAAFPNDGMSALGYWINDTKVDKRVGSLSYQPQPDECPGTFHAPVWVITHQEGCGFQSTVPSFRWTPFVDSRRNWLLTPKQVQQCLSQPVKIYGDSIGHQFRRGIDCLARGFAGLDDGQFLATDVKNLMIEILSIFAPKEYVKNYSDEQLDGILFDASPPQPGEIELWAIGMWVITFIPSRDWERGIRAILSRLRARSIKYGTRPVFSLTSSPSSEPVHAGFFSHINWQTADRARKWNQIVTRVAPIYNITLSDTFFPTVHRFDARVDNVHSCDVLNLETSMGALRTMCLQGESHRWIDGISLSQSSK